jgi:hypothetical protein
LLRDLFWYRALECVGGHRAKVHIMLAGQLAFLAAALFSGAAFYISFAEQPARLDLEDRALLSQWKLSYKRGFVMQASLAMFGFLMGAIAWWVTGRLIFLVGAALLGANWPWTIFGIMPTNDALMTTKPEDAGPNTRELIVMWNGLHSVRIVLGCFATVAFLVGLSY